MTIYQKPLTISEIVIKNILSINAEVSTTEELSSGTPLILNSTNKWEKATDLNVVDAKRVGILLDTANEDGIYMILLIGKIANIELSEKIKVALFNANIVF
ncbi:hypothetical protein [Campylobacter sp. RM12637]|uniref:hypothetical protein n=1 Tax=Campylobacter sp. RM12637 TaxID=2735734 RepID=UPI003014ED03|nr:hypothetical protein [Campylobacter sp. RM12637]